MRGGNRFVALIGLEFLGLFILVALAIKYAVKQPAKPFMQPLLLLLLVSPLLLALAQLIPVPGVLWAKASGRDVYIQALENVNASITAWRGMSVSPDATAASLLAGLPLASALLLGYLASLSQLRLMFRLVIAMAMGQVVLGLFQLSGGQNSQFFLGASTDVAIGTFANRNHLANYLSMALGAYLWLAYEAVRYPQANSTLSPARSRHQLLLWAAGGLMLVLGILMTRSRGAAVLGLPIAAIAFGLVRLKISGSASSSWRFAAIAGLLLVLAAAGLIGFEAATSRFSANEVSGSAGYRAILARTSLDGAIAFWPWGSGWGTYDLAYPRFQPPVIAGYANHAHMDYVEMLFEGGIFFVAFALIFVWLAARRAVLLAGAWKARRFDRECMAAALCGLGLLGLLLHSLVEFNMRIPANAILGALLAGAYLRPLGPERLAHDRSAQPHPARH